MPDRLRARLGLSTGVVVTGGLSGRGVAQEASVAGETPNLASRLRALAEPDAVVIAASTRRLLGDLFEYRDLGSVAVEGIGQVPAWQVLRPSVASMTSARALPPQMSAMSWSGSVGASTMPAP